MLDQTHDWRGEHLIRAREKEDMPAPGWTRAQLIERRERMKSLVSQGLSISSLSDELGITKNAVYSELRKLRAGDF